MGANMIRRVILFIFGIPAFLAVFMFGPAGTLIWTRGWLFIAVFILLEILVVLYVWRTNPELLDARSRLHKGTKRWDKMVMCLFGPSIMAIFLVAALDDGRFHWLPVPDWTCWLGYALLAFGMFISAWAGSVNKFAEPTVRIQTDRGHTVIDTGPYAIVRHPGYVAAFFWFSRIALALGSLWALIPAAVASAVLVVRTYLEDQTLQQELTGYTDYTGRVRYRLIPGLW
jgi:protein-S-isoprenylcysteine O-methyltransferase Ste14